MFKIVLTCFTAMAIMMGYSGTANAQDPDIAEVDGTVSKLVVEEGGLVQEGDLIAEIS